MNSVTSTATVLALVGLFIAAPASTSQPDFSLWLEAFVADAREHGISQPTLDVSLANVERIPAVIELAPLHSNKDNNSASFSAFGTANALPKAEKT